MPTRPTKRVVCRVSIRRVDTYYWIKCYDQASNRYENADETRETLLLARERARDMVNKSHSVEYV